jgi:acetyl esterase/lipase
MLVLALAATMSVAAEPAAVRCPNLANTSSVLPSPSTLEGGEPHVFRTIGDTELRLHLYRPASASGDPRPAIVMFYGGGWMNGSVDQFAPVARHLADRGIVAILADYRTWCRRGADVAEQVADAKAAISWVRQHADVEGIDSSRIAALGGSSGGHLAASSAVFASAVDGISSRPDLLLLFYPCVDLTNPWELEYSAKAIGAHGRDLSPLFHLDGTLPRTFIFQGSEDPLYQENKRFCAEAVLAGASCEWREFSGAGHGFFNPARPDGAEYFWRGLDALEEALVAAGYLQA